MVNRQVDNAVKKTEVDKGECVCVCEYCFK